MYEQDNLEHKVNRNKVIATKEMAEQAFNLVRNERVSIFGICEDGILSGVVLRVEDQQEILCSLQIISDYEIYSLDESVPSDYCLALLFKLIKLSSSKKEKKTMKKLLSKSPEWIKEKKRIFVHFEEENHINSLFSFNNTDELETYWAMNDLAYNFERKMKLEEELLVKHIYDIYPEANFPVLKSAMEALINLFKSSVNDEHILELKPLNNDVLGFYKVKKKKEGKRSYSVLLTENNGLTGSCSCKDYQHNTLRWCKHLATVFLHWQRGPRIIKRFKSETQLNNPRLAWKPIVKFGSLTDDLVGLKILNFPLKVKSKLMNELKSYFYIDGTINIKKVSSGNKRIEFLRLLNKCISIYKNKSLLIEPAIPTLVDAALEFSSWSHIYKKGRKKLIKTIDSLNFDLYDYQKEGIEAALSEGRFLLADEMGLGKTVQGIGFAEALLQKGYVKKVLLITPAALKSQWRREWNLASGRDITIVEGVPDARKFLYEGNHQILAINYELLLRDLELIKKFDADLIILDEAQRIKNFQTETSRRVKMLKPYFRLILTGTPMENRISELSSLLDWIKPSVLGPSWRLNSELNYHNPENPDEKGVKNLSVIRDRMSSYFLRRTRKEVLTQLPSRSDCPIYLPITEEQKDIHEGFASIVSRLMAISESRPLAPSEHIRLMANLTKMRIVSNGVAQLQFDDFWDEIKDQDNPESHLNSLYAPKLLEFRNLVQGLITQEDIKIVIFSQWQRMLRLCHWAVKDILSDNNIEAVFFTGKENTSKRTENICRFHDDAKVRLFFATDAGGVGINLQRAANICINLELPWNPAVLEQRIGRIYRIGQDRPIQIFNLITKDSIEERISALVEQKKAIFNALFEGESDEIRFSKKSGFYEQVKEVVSDSLVENEVSDINIIDIENTNDNYADEKLTEGPSSNSIEKNDSNEKKLHNSAENSRNENLGIIENNEISPELPFFKDVKVEYFDGTLKIEAKKESAEMMANMFKMMGQLFESKGS